MNQMLNIIDFGAVNDGKALCTQAFSKAIEQLVLRGGGTLFVPAGEYLTGPIILKSNIALFVDTGAKIKFSQNIDDYNLVYERWEGAECEVYCSCIYADGEENISISGKGTIDGQGEFWWKGFREKTLSYPRPRLINFNRCKRVTIEDVKLINSPSWTVNPILCENITIDNIFIENPADSPNTDGIDPESCKNVRISNCHIDVGDDCIAIKAGTEDCIERVPCQNIAITNCTMLHGHGGVVLGSEMSGGIKNVVISNCIFEGTDRGIRIKSRRGRGGIVEDIRVSNIIMQDVLCPFALNLYYHCGKGGKEKMVWDKNSYPVDETTPIFRRIHFSNITARGISAAAGFLYGLPEMPIEEVTFDNISVELSKKVKLGMPDMLCHFEPVAQKGFMLCNYRDVSFKNVKVTGQDGEAYILKNEEDEVSL